MTSRAWPTLAGALMGLGIAGALWSWSPPTRTAVVLLGVCLVAVLARNPLRNAVNGVWLRRDGVKPGQYIRLEGQQDVEGYVERVGATRTTLHAPLGARQTIPNQVLANAVFTSFHLGDDRHALVDIEAHESVPGRDVLPVLQDATRASPDIDPLTIQIHQLPGRFPGSRRYSVRCRLKETSRRPQAEAALHREATRRLREAGIPVPDYLPPQDTT
jgi:hypothetical protein